MINKFNSIASVIKLTRNLVIQMILCLLLMRQNCGWLSGKALSSETYGTGFDDLSCWNDVGACKKALSVRKCLVFKCSLCAKKKKIGIH